MTGRSVRARRLWMRFGAVGVVSLLALVAVACEPATLGGSASAVVYDAAGRMVGVVQSGGDAALYKYDALGNVVSVHRYSASALGVMAVVPAQAPSGASVVVKGTGFGRRRR